MVVVCQVNPNLQVLQIHMNFHIVQMQVESVVEINKNVTIPFMTTCDL
jgi:hypothetical protein